MKIALVSQSYYPRFGGVTDVTGPNYTGARGMLEVSRNDKPLTTLYPEKRVYVASGMPFTESAIDYGFTRDLYTALGERLDGGAWSVRLFHKPFVVWIWIGVFIIVAGTAICLLPAGLRFSGRRPDAAAGAEAAA